MNVDLDYSYQACEAVARKAASNFVWCFQLLPRPQRNALYALYAFARHADDLGDSPLPASVRRDALAAWRRQLEEALAGRCRDATLPALVHAVHAFAVPEQYLFDILDGVEMDLEPRGFDTFEALRVYCSRVAASVGLACLHIWGFADGDDRVAVPLAIERGVAFQLTNILRDLRQDAQCGRVYLPRQDLHRFDCPPDALQDPGGSESTRALLRFEIARAESLYRSSRGLAALVHPAGRRMLNLMTGTYWHLLQRIRRSAESGPVESPRLTLATRLHILHSSLCPWGRVCRERF
ncbi:MAG: phytoene/squalene synthase family protein [Pirellulaceae bacterium]|jgi:phytoene synthase|nr:phytoene/squalene synthase family protein [Pirellulaceae bacterium]